MVVLHRLFRTVRDRIALKEIIKSQFLLYFLIVVKFELKQSSIVPLLYHYTIYKQLQVLIGHTDTVTCVAVAVSDKTHVVSGSCDNNLIVWDINTGADLHTLSAHLSFVSCCKMSGDGSILISGEYKVS